MDLLPKNEAVDEDASGEGVKSMQGVTEGKPPTSADIIKGHDVDVDKKEPSYTELKQVELQTELTKNDTSMNQTSQFDESTDTVASTNANADKQNILQVALAKQDYSEVFNQLELNFFEKLFRIANIAQDGQLNESELMFFLDHHDYVISKQEARQIVKEGDTDKNGALNFGEFLGLCKRANVNLEAIGILSQDTEFERQLGNSLKIRNLFRTIFDTINLAPSIQETVEYWENKIAASASALDCKFNKLECMKTKRGSLSKKEGVKSQDQDNSDDASESSEYDYDLIILGNGAGGVVGKEAAKAGKRVAICDPSPTTSIKSLNWRFGGSCSNVGCVPKLLMNYAGVVGDTVDKRTSNPFGWSTPDCSGEKTGISPEPQVEKCIFNNDWTTLVDNIQGYIRTLNYQRQYDLQYYKGIKYYSANCEFDGPHKIIVTHDDKTRETITGEKIVIAVGSTYHHLDIPGAAGNCITVDDIFSMRHHPGRVLIVGGGPDAIECAGLLCGLNISVTIMSRSPVLKGYDRRMATLILETLHSRGVKIMIGWTPMEIFSDARDSEEEAKPCLTPNDAHMSKRKLTVVSKHVQTGERSNKDFDTIVLAIGKKPATPLLKLQNAEVLTDSETHKIWVDSLDMTTAEDVFAIGDCASQRPCDSPVHYQAGINLSKRLYHGQIEAMEYDQVMPKFLLTYPHSYACVGLSEEAAIVEHGETNIEVYHSRFLPLQYQLGSRSKAICYAKMITLKSEKERVVGLHFLGLNAGDIMQGFSLAIKLKATKADLDSMIGIHPTAAEIFSRMTKTFEESDFVLNSTC